MIIDGHQHIVDSSEPILRLMDRQGVDRAVLVGIGVSDLDAVSIGDSVVFHSPLLLRTVGLFKSRRVLRGLRKRNILLPVPRNDAVLKAIAAYPDRFSGFAFVNPLHPDALSQARDCLAAGMCGLKFAHLQYPPDPAGEVMWPYAALARQTGVPLFIHLGLHFPIWLDPLCAAFPDVFFIMAHAAVQHFDPVVALAEQRPNILFDTSSYFVTDRKLRRLVERVGTRRILYGSDMPVMAASMSEGIDKIRRLNLCPDDEAALLGRNLENLLAIGGSLREVGPA